MLKVAKKKNIDIKKEAVDGLTSKLEGASAVVFTNYQGMTMPQVNELRGKLDSVGAEFTVTKNTLTSRALKERGLSVGEANLEGPTATLFAQKDAIEAIKALFTFTKTNQLPKVKFGIFEAKLISDAELEQISKLLGKAELLGQIVGTIGSPLYGLVGTLRGNLSNLILTLKSVEAQKSGWATRSLAVWIKVS